MTGKFPDVTYDKNLNDIFRQQKNNLVDRIRTGMGMYREWSVQEIMSEFSNPMIQRNFIDNEEVLIEPEIENDPYTLYYKSLALTDLQTAWCLCNGLKRMMYNLFQFCDRKIDDFEPITKALSEKIPFYNTLGRLIPTGKRSEGIAIIKSPTNIVRQRALGGFPKLFQHNYWYDWVNTMGFPVGYDWKHAEFLLLSGDDILTFSDQEIDDMLKRGAVIDGRAVQCLVFRGFGSRIGVRSAVFCQKEFVSERFLQSEKNAEYAGFTNADYLCSSLLTPYDIYDIDYASGAEQLSEIIDVNEARVCNGVTLYQNEQRERFCILPFDGSMFVSFTMVNYKRKRQLSNVFEWIAQKPLLATAETARTAIVVNSFEKRNVISLFNLSFDCHSEIKIKYTPRGEMFFIDTHGRKKKLQFQQSSDCLIIPITIAPFQYLILIDEWRGKQI